MVCEKWVRNAAWWGVMNGRGIGAHPVKHNEPVRSGILLFNRSFPAETSTWQLNYYDARTRDCSNSTSELDPSMSSRIANPTIRMAQPFSSPIRQRHILFTVLCITEALGGVDSHSCRCTVCRRTVGTRRNERVIREAHHMEMKGEEFYFPFNAWPLHSDDGHPFVAEDATDDLP